jgi:hypothetical protein
VNKCHVAEYNPNFNVLVRFEVVAEITTRKVVSEVLRRVALVGTDVS